MQLNLLKSALLLLAAAAGAQHAGAQGTAASTAASTATSTASTTRAAAAKGGLMSTLSAAMNATPTPAPTPSPTATPAAQAGAAAAAVSPNGKVIQELKGQKALQQFCMECHGHNKGPNLVTRRYSPARIKKTVRQGNGNRMPAFPETKIDNDTLEAIVAYLQDVESRFAPARAQGGQSRQKRGGGQGR